MKKQTVELLLQDIYLKKKDLISFGYAENSSMYKVLRCPRTNKWHRFLNKITFRLYKLNPNYFLKEI